MATTDPTPEHVINTEDLNERRVRLELAYVYATAHPGEDKKAKNFSDFIKVMLPVVMNGDFLP